MSKTSDIRVLVKLRPLLRLLNVYNRSHFEQPNWRDLLKSIGSAFGVTVIVISLPVFIVLIAWNLIDNGIQWKQCVVGVPIMITLSQYQLILIAMLI